MIQALFGKKGTPKNSDTSLEVVPIHIAMIMDGNGRWAGQRMLPRIEGHRAGAKTVRMVVEECLKLGVRYLTVYAFSTENWSRPAEEVSGLMKLFDRYLREELSLFKKHNVRLRAIGDRTRLDPVVRKSLEDAEKDTKDNTAMDFIIAVSYSGREELVHAARSFASACVAGKAVPESLTPEMFAQFFHAPDLPDVDLLIRTSDEIRLSNFLLWQLAYAEIVVTPVFWPDFSPEEFRRCLETFGKRSRRFGLTQDQLTEYKRNAV